MHRVLCGTSWLIVFAACSDPGVPIAAPEPVTLEAISGNWDATEYALVDFADLTHTYDFLRVTGLTLSAEINDWGGLILTFSGSPPDTGFLSLLPDNVLVQYPYGLRYAVTLSRDHAAMTWVGLDTIPHDIDGEGTVEDTFVRFHWRRH